MMLLLSAKTTTTTKNKNEPCFFSWGKRNSADAVGPKLDAANKTPEEKW